MTVGLSANPGQTVTIAVEVKNSGGQRVDGYVPQVDFVDTPSGLPMSGYPDNMVRLSEGLYTAAIVIPSGLTAVGTYVVSASWVHPNTGLTQYEAFLINAALPFGNATVTML
jgi:hypothetical protein